VSNDISLHPDKSWDYYWLSRNPNITWEIVQANPHKPWDYYWLSMNPNITWEIVSLHPTRPWNYYMLSSNPNITWEIICNDLSSNDISLHPVKLCHYSWLSCNPNLTWKIIYENMDKPWKFELLSTNPMNRQPAATKIQRIFRSYRKIKRFKRGAYFQLRKLFAQYIAAHILGFIRVSKNNKKTLMR